MSPPPSYTPGYKADVYILEYQQSGYVAALPGIVYIVIFTITFQKYGFYKMGYFIIFLGQNNSDKDKQKKTGITTEQMLYSD